ARCERIRLPALPRRRDAAHPHHASGAVHPRHLQQRAGGRRRGRAAGNDGRHHLRVHEAHVEARAMIALHFFSRLYLCFVYLFVIGPMLILIIDSLNSATSFPSPFETVTLRWYVAVLRHDEFLTAMRVSAIVAALAATIATVLGFLAAYALVRYPLRGENAVATFLLAPILVPQIVIGLAMLQLLALLGVQLTLAGLVAVHTIYVMPFTLRLVMTGLARFDF